jgi:apolipoprotein N-acyltransferase
MEQGSAALAAASSDLRFWRKLAASTPLVRRFVPREAPEARRLWPLALLGFPPVALWLLVWGVAASLLWLIRLLVESGGAAGAGLLWGSGLLLSSIERIFAPRHAGS